MHLCVSWYYTRLMLNPYVNWMNKSDYVIWITKAYLNRLINQKNYSTSFCDLYTNQLRKSISYIEGPFVAFAEKETLWGLEKYSQARIHFIILYICFISLLFFILFKHVKVTILFTQTC